MKESSPTKRSCIRRRSSCLNGSFVRMKRTVGQHVLGTSAHKSNKESNHDSNTIWTSRFGSFESRNTFRPTPSQSWRTAGVPAMLTVKAFEDLFRRLLQADAARPPRALWLQGFQVHCKPGAVCHRRDIRGQN